MKEPFYIRFKPRLRIGKWRQDEKRARWGRRVWSNASANCYELSLYGVMFRSNLKRWIPLLVESWIPCRQQMGSPPHWSSKNSSAYDRKLDMLAIKRTLPTHLVRGDLVHSFMVNPSIRRIATGNTATGPSMAWAMFPGVYGCPEHSEQSIDCTLFGLLVVKTSTYSAFCKEHRCSLSWGTWLKMPMKGHGRHSG